MRRHTRSAAECASRLGAERHQPAFTLIEILIVVTIMALLAMAMSISFSGAKDRATFDDQKVKIVDLFQKARGSSLSSVLVGTEPVDYYRVYVIRTGITLTAYAGINTELIDSLTFTDGVYVSSPTSVYYFPPYGVVCFTSDCHDTIASGTFTLRNAAGELTIYRVYRHGGYIEES